MFQSYGLNCMIFSDRVPTFVVLYKVVQYISNELKIFDSMSENIMQFMSEAE
jgi:hypothetical protein